MSRRNKQVPATRSRITKEQHVIRDEVVQKVLKRKKRPRGKNLVKEVNARLGTDFEFPYETSRDILDDMRNFETRNAKRKKVATEKKKAKQQEDALDCLEVMTSLVKGADAEVEEDYEAAVQIAAESSVCYMMRRILIEMGV